MSATETRSTKSGMNPGSPSLTSGENHTEKSGYHPQKHGRHKKIAPPAVSGFDSDHASLDFLHQDGRENDTRQDSERHPQAIAEYVPGSVTCCDKDTPSALAVEVAAGSSYVIAPITLMRIQGRGFRGILRSVTTPSKMDTAGAMEKLQLTKWFSAVFTFILISFPLRYAVTRKRRTGRARIRLQETQSDIKSRCLHQIAWFSS